MSDPNTKDNELIQKQLKYCKDLINRVKRSTYSSPFKEPVDPVKLGCPDYFEKIKTPMDLSTIKSKLDSATYTSVDEFKDDFYLMLNNCYTYNPEGAYVNKCGKEIEKLFESLCSNIPQESVKKRKVELRAMEECNKILSEILKSKNKKFTWPFLEPVDKNLVPDYYDIIKNPVDLSLIQKKLSSSKYDSKESFYKDLDIMLENCFSYNDENSDVYKCGLHFKSFIDSIKENNEGLKLQISELKNKICQLEKELESLQSKLSNTKNYTLADRVEIAKRIENLPEISIGPIIRIIQKHKKDLDLSQKEVEVDLKYLSNKAIEEIETCLSKNNKENYEDSTSTI